jgi:predicted transposase/invertase (TIGR01784 family)
MQTPHDRLFRRVFSDPEHAAGELQLLLPVAISARVDWSTLHPEKTDFIRDVLTELRSDVLFSVRLDGERELFIYLLMEHQSTPDALMPLRLLGYMLQIQERYVREHPDARRVPAVVPMVVHHGEDGWSAPVSFEELLDLDDDERSALADHVPRFRFLLDDLSLARDDDLRARSVTELGRLALFCLSRARESGDFLTDLERWSDILIKAASAPNGVAALASLVRYILEVVGAPPEEIRTFLTGLGPQVEEAYMTGAQILIERGRKEGEAKGRKEGRAETLLNLLERKFGAVPSASVERIEHASIDELDRWALRVLDATSLDEVLAD